MSTTVSKKVKMKDKGVVAEIDIIQYESVQEAVEDKDEKYILGLINAQTVTNAMNAERASHRESAPGKKKRHDLAFNLLPKLTINGKSGLDLLIEVAGDAAALEKLLLSPEVQAAVDEHIGAAG